MVKVGVVGLGKMGTAFALNLLSRQNEVHVYNRSKEKLRAVVDKGAVSHPSPYELGKAVDVVLTSLPDQDVVDSLVTGREGLLAGLRKGSLWIEASTIDPEASARQAGQAAKQGIDRLDCPVIGNPEMVALGRLSILVGGERRVFEKYREFLAELGSSLIYVGGPGKGHSMKLIINLFLGMNSIIFTEALVLARKMRLDPSGFVDAFNKTAHKNYYSEVKGPRIAKGDYTPLFTVNMLLKDLTLADNQIRRVGAALPLAGLTRQLFAASANQDHGELDFSGIVLTIEDLNDLRKTSQ